MTNRGQSALGAFVQSPLGVFGKGGAPEPQPVSWKVFSAVLRPSPGTNDRGYRADCDTSGSVAPGNYLDVAAAADSLADVLKRTFVEANAIHVQDARTQYVYTIGPPYNCNYINGPPGGTRPITDWPSGLNPTNPDHPPYSGSDWLPWWAWELNTFGPPPSNVEDVAQFGFKLPVMRNQEGFADNSPILFTDVVDLSTAFQCTECRLVPANTPGPGNTCVGSDCTTQLLPFPGWRCQFDRVVIGETLGIANLLFRKMRITGQLGGYQYDCDDRAVLDRYQCPTFDNANVTVLDDQFPAWGPGYPFEQFDRVSAPVGTFNRFTMLIPQSESAAAPFVAGEAITWEILP